MSEDELKSLIHKLKQEDEIPYLEAKSNLSDLYKIGKTVSALSNSASWKNEEYGYLIWGLEDQTWQIIGTDFQLKKIKEGNLDGNLWLKDRGFDYKCDFEEFEFIIENKRVYGLKIKNCGNEPLYFFHKDKQAWIAHIREGQNNDELKNFPERLKYICSKKLNFDWSAGICEGATVENLDGEAVAFLREKLVKAKGNIEFKTLEITNLLNRVNLLTEGKINNTCALFLGKPEVTDKYLMDKNKISWVWRDELNDFEERLSLDEMKKPFILLLPEIQKQIQRKNTYLKDLDIFAEDIWQYDEKAVEEVLVNAIAHRNWEIPLWIEVVQTPISLEIRNPGKFEADWDRVLKYNEKPPYKNPNLVHFLNHIKLMEREGNGIRKVYKTQVGKGLEVIQRSVATNRVDFILTGKVKNVDFAKFVLNRTNLKIDQLRVLEKIINGKDMLDKDIDQEEYSSIENFVTKTSRGKHLKIKPSFLKFHSDFQKDFSSKNTSPKTSFQIVIDYAIQVGNEFTTDEIYQVFNTRPKTYIRNLLSDMCRQEQIVRIKKGLYIKNTTKT